VTFSVDGGGHNPLALPVEIGTTGELTTTISAANSTGATKYITVLFSDQALAEWQDVLYIIMVMDAVDTLAAADVWGYHTRTLTVGLGHLKTSVLGTIIEIFRGDTLIINITKLGDISARDNIWFTVKSDNDDADTAAQIQIDEDTGLLFIVGAAGTAGNGSITVTDAVAGNITIRLEAVEAAKLANDFLGYFDIQTDTAGLIATLRYGNAKVLADVTRSTG